METLNTRMQRYMLSNPLYSNQIARSNKITLMADDGGDPGSGDSEIKKYFTFDETGHIMISSTVPDEKDMDPGVRDVFQKAIVFFSAWTAAISQKNKTLYDYDAVSAIIGQSGYFVDMGTEDRTFDYTSHEMSLGNAIIADALGSISAGDSSMKIAANIVKGLGGQLRVSSTSSDSKKKIGQLMFVCQDLMGMPIVNVSLFYIEKDETTSVVSTDCSQSTTDTIHFVYHKQDYMFVDPDMLKKYASDFTQTPEYLALIKKLADCIPADAPAPAPAPAH